MSASRAPLMSPRGKRSQGFSASVMSTPISQSSLQTTTTNVVMSPTQLRASQSGADMPMFGEPPVYDPAVYANPKPDPLGRERNWVVESVLCEVGSVCVGV